MASSEYEKIYTVFDFYDGIRTGIADYNGARRIIRPWLASTIGIDAGGSYG
jgi:hypothetical protein